MNLKSGVHPDGRFIVGVHRPRYRAENFRCGHSPEVLGELPDGQPKIAHANFPDGPVHVSEADWVYEIPNPFPFRGTTYINRAHADRFARHPETIRLPERQTVSFCQWLSENHDGEPVTGTRLEAIAAAMPEPLLLALAANSTDPEDLELLAGLSCEFVRDPTSGRPTGLRYDTGTHRQSRPIVLRETLFELVSNNPFLPDDYKNVMVLRPGAQGGSPVVGEWPMDGSGTHVFEYLRRNSYIPWGHYAANMANDAIRYRAADLSRDDVRAMRHLYYQRSYARIAALLGVGDFPDTPPPMDPEALENMRQQVAAALETGQAADSLPLSATIWGWNYGFDYAPSGYRLHASHQQIHQQYAMIPDTVASPDESESFVPFACGDLVATAVADFRESTGVDFFDAYTRAIRTNKRTDGAADGPSGLVVFEDPRVMLFVPKGQTSQWELQLMPVSPVGNILEADTDTRRSLDLGIWTAMRILGGLGARMVTSIEFSRRFQGGEPGQRLFYSFLPRLPHSPGAFSEAQLRWVNRHYPEDFAEACRRIRDGIH